MGVPPLQTNVRCKVRPLSGQAHGKPGALDVFEGQVCRLEGPRKWRRENDFRGRVQRLCCSTCSCSLLFSLCSQLGVKSAAH